jgi:hypothetical protein
MFEIKAISSADAAWNSDILVRLLAGNTATVLAA